MFMKNQSSMLKSDFNDSLSNDRFITQWIRVWGRLINEKQSKINVFSSFGCNI